ncbi:MAG: HAMP domain-containing sensor histidine kinase [Thermodesulfobacteriota bacterium]
MKFVRKKISSIFTKLLIVIICTGLCINFSIGAVFHQIFKNLAETPLERNIIQYANYLVEDMGSPPQYERAVEIAKTSSLKIRYDGPETHWSTSPDIPDMKKARTHIWHEGEGVTIGKYRHHYLVQISRGPHRLTFDLERRFQQEDTHKKLAVMFIVMCTLILAGAYLIMRLILRPLKWLTEGVEHVSRGNLDHKVPVRRKGELADLAKAFNNMTKQFKEMLHARERLMLDVSHELRSPLTRLKVALEFLPESAAKESLKEDVVIMETMIAEILETARLRNGYATLNLKATDLVPLVQGVVAGFAGASPGVAAEDMPATMQAVVDAELCRTVLKNIITNAVKYSGSSEAPVAVSLSRQATHAVIEIRDHGAGIPEEDMPYIFEPFYRVEKSRSQTIKGYGLGLNLCKTIMEAHNGRIEIESSLGEGTTVTLSFPEKQEA